MSPKTEAYGITIVMNSLGGARICQVIVADLPPATLARMREARQLDCGKRQAITPLTVDRLSEPAATALINAGLVDADTDTLTFEQKDEAKRAFQLILQIDQRFRPTELDRTIPCQ